MKVLDTPCQKQLRAAALMHYDTLHYMFVYPLSFKDNTAD